MAHRGGENAAKKVEIAPPLCIPDVDTIAPFQRQRLGVVENVVWPEIATLFFQNFLGVHEAFLSGRVRMGGKKLVMIIAQPETVCYCAPMARPMGA